jgi:GNAT superfamily N-acetyltransferase
MSDTDAVLRWARADDRGALSEICRRTGDAGSDATDTLVHGELYGLLWAEQYLVHAPSFALVADVGGCALGYVLAAPDTEAFETLLESEWWPPLRERYPLPGDGTDVDRRLVAYLHHPPRTPTSVTDRYPAHLHIDLLPELQGQGLGRRMIAAIEQRLAEAGCTGVHLGVDPRNEHAIGFYEHLGYTPHRTEGTVLFTKRL